MSRFYTYFWSDEFCDARYRAGFSGAPIDYTVGDGFRAAGIEDDDMLYIISVYDGQMMLIGRLVAGRILTSYNEALALLGPDVEEAQEYVLAAEDTGTPQYFTRQLMMEETGDLRFLAPNGNSKPLKFADNDEVDVRGLAGLHEIPPASAVLLDHVLLQDFHDHLPDAEHEGEEEDEIDDSDLAAISRSFADEEVNQRVRDRAFSFVITAFEEKGWTVMEVDDPEEGYDLQCTIDDDHLHVVVKGTANDAVEFMLSELEYARAERDGHFALCLVTAALSGDPSLVTFNGEDLYDLFDARPVRWAFRYRAEEDGLDTEDF